MPFQPQSKTDGLQVYLVGGAVRDQLLGLPPKDRDWVIVGTTPDEMLNRGFIPVGKHFPVFLHPDTKEAYALARTERKTSSGYHGFVFHTGPEVTLNEDLQRRDITLNAMAQTADGHLIDPFGGYTDLKNRIIRHVSPAFSEDPVRILRVARFAARFADLHLKIAPETLQLMVKMVRQGEVDALIPERVWQEFEIALGEQSPRIFIEVLRRCGALQRILPELDRLWGIPQPAKFHPEVDVGEHVLLVLDQATQLSPLPQVRFAALMHDLGKGITPKTDLPSHPGHEHRGVAILDTLSKRLGVPKAFKTLAQLVCREHGLIHRCLELRPSTLLQLLERLDVLRKPDRFEEILLCCIADARGRHSFENCAYPQADYLRKSAAIIRNISAQPFLEKGFTGQQIHSKLAQERLHQLTIFRNSLASP